MDVAALELELELEELLGCKAQVSTKNAPVSPYASMLDDAIPLGH